MDEQIQKPSHTLFFVLLIAYRKPIKCIFQDVIHLFFFFLPVLLSNELFALMNKLLKSTEVCCISWYLCKTMENV
jgi:hypothetical protein